MNFADASNPFGDESASDYLMDKTNRRAPRASSRKRTRSLGLRNWRNRYQANRAGFASKFGVSLYAADEDELDRSVVLFIETREEAFNVLLLLADYLNESQVADPGFCYGAVEFDRAADNSESLSLQLRGDEFPSKQLSLTNELARIIRAALTFKA